MSTVTNWGEAIFTSLTNALILVFAFIPKLLGFLVILLVGWLIARLLSRVVTALLRKVGFDRLSDRIGLTQLEQRTGTKLDSAGVLGQIVYWFIFLIFLVAAVDVLGLRAVSGILHSLVLYIPNVFVAILVLFLGALFATVVADIVRGVTATAKIGNPNIFAGIARWSILLFAFLIALEQLLIAPVLLNLLFLVFAAGIALAFGIAFGLGGWPVVYRWLVRYRYLWWGSAVASPVAQGVAAQTNTYVTDSTATVTPTQEAPIVGSTSSQTLQTSPSTTSEVLTQSSQPATSETAIHTGEAAIIAGTAAGAAMTLGHEPATSEAVTSASEAAPLTSQPASETVIPTSESATMSEVIVPASVPIPSEMVTPAYQPIVNDAIETVDQTSQPSVSEVTTPASEPANMAMASEATVDVTDQVSQPVASEATIQTDEAAALIAGVATGAALAVSHGPSASKTVTETSEPPVTVAEAGDVSFITAYCSNCQRQRTILHSHRIVLEDGSSAFEGVCSVCGQNLSRSITEETTPSAATPLLVPAEAAAPATESETTTAVTQAAAVAPMARTGTEQPVAEAHGEVTHSGDQPPIVGAESQITAAAITAYCFNCKRPRTILYPQHVVQDGHSALEGLCSICGGRLFRLVREETAPSALATQTEAVASTPVPQADATTAALIAPIEVAAAPATTPIGATTVSSATPTEVTATHTAHIMGTAPITEYCSHCKKVRTMLNPQEITLNNGHPALRGICSICSGRLLHLIPVETTPKVAAAQTGSTIDASATPTEAVTVAPTAQPEVDIAPTQTAAIPLVESQAVAPATQEAAVVAPATSAEVTAPTTQADVPATPSVTPVDAAASTAYCFHCKQQRTITSPQSVVLKNGNRAVEGPCSVCGRWLFHHINEEMAPTTSATQAGAVAPPSTSQTGATTASPVAPIAMATTSATPTEAATSTPAVQTAAPAITSTTSTGTGSGTAHCFHCKQQRTITSPQHVVLHNGHHAVEGPCSVCGRWLFSLLKGGTTGAATTTPDTATAPAVASTEAAVTAAETSPVSATAASGATSTAPAMQSSAEAETIDHAEVEEVDEDELEALHHEEDHAPLSLDEESGAGITAYCVKCKQKRTMVDPQRVVLKNGHPALKGTCPICGRKLFRLIKNGATDGASAPSAPAAERVATNSTVSPSAQAVGEVTTSTSTSTSTSAATEPVGVAPAMQTGVEQETELHEEETDDDLEETPHEEDHPLTLGSQAKGDVPSISAYCVKCKHKRVMLNPYRIVMNNGRPAMKGICPVCRRKLFRLLKA